MLKVRGDTFSLKAECESSNRRYCLMERRVVIRLEFRLHISYKWSRMRISNIRPSPMLLIIGVGWKGGEVGGKINGWQTDARSGCAVERQPNSSTSITVSEYDTLISGRHKSEFFLIMASIGSTICVCCCKRAAEVPFILWWRFMYLDRRRPQRRYFKE